VKKGGCFKVFENGRVLKPIKPVELPDTQKEAAEASRNHAKISDSLGGIAKTIEKMRFQIAKQEKKRKAYAVEKNFKLLRLKLENKFFKRHPNEVKEIDRDIAATVNHHLEKLVFPQLNMAKRNYDLTALAEVERQLHSLKEKHASSAELLLQRRKYLKNQKIAWKPNNLKRRN
jgi:predicted DNA-binding antitoxin AbrB/MazE fold protein